MTRSTKIIAGVLALLIVGGVALKTLVFNDARQVREAVLALQEKIAAPPGDGGQDWTGYGAALQPCFAPEVAVADGHGGARTLKRDELANLITSVRRQNPALTVSLVFDRKDIVVQSGGQTATVAAVIRLANPGSVIEPQPRVLVFNKDGGTWQLAAVQDSSAAPGQGK
jgi:hypothetical protein